MRLSDIGNIRCKASTDITYPLPSRPTTIKLLYFPHFSIFFLFKKSKRLQKKSKLCPQKGKQASLKSKSFCAMLRKKRLKCGRIPARLFLPVIKNPILLSASSFAAQNRCMLTFLWATPRDPGNATPQYIARGSQLVARHIRTQTRRSLNGCVLVRLASQAVPSPVSVGRQTLQRGY